MTTGLKPFDEHAQLDYFKFLDMRASGERPGPIPANNPLKDILNQCLDANPEIRPTFSVLINQLEALKQKPAPSWRASSIQRHSIQKVYLRHLQDFEEAKKKALATPSNTNVKPEKVANKFQVGNDVKQIFERMWVNDDESDYAIFEYDDTNSLKVATSAKDGMEGKGIKFFSSAIKILIQHFKVSKNTCKSEKINGCIFITAQGLQTSIPANTSLYSSLGSPKKFPPSNAPLFLRTKPS